MTTDSSSRSAGTTPTRICFRCKKLVFVDQVCDCIDANIENSLEQNAEIWRELANVDTLIAEVRRLRELAERNAWVAVTEENRAVDDEEEIERHKRRGDTYRARSIALREQAEGIRYEMRQRLAAADTNLKMEQWRNRQLVSGIDTLRAENAELRQRCNIYGQAAEFMFAEASDALEENTGIVDALVEVLYPAMQEACVLIAPEASHIEHIQAAAKDLIASNKQYGLLADIHGYLGNDDTDFEDLPGLVDELLAENARLREALEYVELDDDGHCPWCKGGPGICPDAQDYESEDEYLSAVDKWQRASRHTPDCMRQRALNGGENDD